MQNDGTYDIIKPDYEYNDTSIINRFIAFKNPFRYRSYYYDFETNLYYLNSRYYDPEIGRFINADDVKNAILQMVKFNGLSLYAYCLNRPVMMIDNLGQFALPVFKMQQLNKIVGNKRNLIVLLANKIKSTDLGQDKKGSIPFANLISRFSYSESLIQDQFLAALIGNLSYTVTYQLDQQGFFYSYSDIGIEGSYMGYGVGINLNGVFGIEIGVTAGSFWDLGINASVSIGNLSIGGSIGTSGIGFNLGFTSGNVTTTVGGTIGWGTIGLATALLLAPDPTGLTKIAAGLILFFDWLF